MDATFESFASDRTYAGLGDWAPDRGGVCESPMTVSAMHEAALAPCHRLRRDLLRAPVGRHWPAHSAIAKASRSPRFSAQRLPAGRHGASPTACRERSHLGPDPSRTGRPMGNGTPSGQRGSRRGKRERSLGRPASRCTALEAVPSLADRWLGGHAGGRPGDTADGVLRPRQPHVVGGPATRRVARDLRTTMEEDLSAVLAGRAPLISSPGPSLRRVGVASLRVRRPRCGWQHSIGGRTGR